MYNDERSQYHKKWLTYAEVASLNIEQLEGVVKAGYDLNDNAFRFAHLALRCVSSLNDYNRERAKPNGGNPDMRKCFAYSYENSRDQIYQLIEIYDGRKRGQTVYSTVRF